MVRPTPIADFAVEDLACAAIIFCGTTAPRSGSSTCRAGSSRSAPSSHASIDWPAGIAAGPIAGTSSTSRSNPRMGGRTGCAPRCFLKRSGPNISILPTIPHGTPIPTPPCRQRIRCRARRARAGSTPHALLRCSKRMQRAGTPVDAVGIQAHLVAVGGPPFSASRLRRFLADIASLGLTIQITELDVTDENAPADIATFETGWLPTPIAASSTPRSTSRR